MLSKSGAGAKRKCKFYDELQELFGCRPVNIQEGIDSFNAFNNQDSLNTFNNQITCDLNIYDNVPDADASIPGCSDYCNETSKSTDMNLTNNNQNIDSNNNTHDLLTTHKENELDDDVR